MAELSEDDVVAILGPRVSDALAAEIIAIGVTKEELQAAFDRVVKDRKAHIPARRSSRAGSRGWSIFYRACTSAACSGKRARRWNSEPEPSRIDQADLAVEVAGLPGSQPRPLRQ